MKHKLLISNNGILWYSMSSEQEDLRICRVPQQLKIKKLNQHAQVIYSDDIYSKIIITDKLIRTIKYQLTYSHYAHNRRNLLKALNDIFYYYYTFDFKDIDEEKTT